MAMLRYSALASILVVIVCIGCTKKSTDDDTGIVVPPRPVFPSVWEMPAWSPDGKTIACFCTGVYDVNPSSGSCSIDFDRRGFYLMDTDGSNQRKISDEEIMCPAWHPHGDSLVFSMIPYGGAIFKADTTMDSVIQLTEVEGCFQPAWSPDGTKVLYHKISYPGFGLWIMRSDGSDKTLVSEVYNASWSPKGDRISCASKGGLSMVDSNGAFFELLAPGFGCNRSAFSANGDEIFFSDNERLRKYVMSTDTVIELAISASYPSPSPDGDQLVYLGHTWVYYSLQNGNLWIMNSDGSNKHQITFTEGGDSL